MKPGLVLLIFKDVVQDLQDNGMITADGSFNFPSTAAPYEVLASKVNAQLLAHGVTEPRQVQAIIGMIPLILMLSGVQ